DEEHLDLDRPALAVEAEDVLIGAPVRDHLLALLRLLDGLDLVTQTRRLLEALRRGGGLHATPQRRGHLAAAALQQLHCLAQVLLVGAAVDGEHTRPEAALDVVLDARAGAVAEDGVAAGAEGEYLPDRVERIAHGGRAVERPEVPAAVLHDAPGHQHARPRLL